MIAESRKVALLALCLVGCADLTAPSGGIEALEKSEGSEPRVVANAPTPAPAPAPAPSPPPAPAPAAAGAAQQVRASHVLVSFKGSARAKPEVTRSKEEAKKRAEQVAARAKKGEDFAALAKEMSDGPTGPRGGDLGKFTKDRMVKPFADAAFALEPGGISEVVETQFGFHVIKRTE